MKSGTTSSLRSTSDDQREYLWEASIQTGPGRIYQRMLSQTGLPATSLKLEITENALMEHTDVTMDVLHQLRSMGFNPIMIWIGYSSLSYLSRSGECIED